MADANSIPDLNVAWKAIRLFLTSGNSTTLTDESHEAQLLKECHKVHSATMLNNAPKKAEKRR
jgi:hypothetical protein